MKEELKKKRKEEMDKRKAVEPARNDPKKWSITIMSHILWVIIYDKVL